MLKQQNNYDFKSELLVMTDLNEVMSRVKQALSGL